MKKLFIILSLIVVCVIILVIFLYFNLNTIIEQGIKRVGPKVVKTKVGLDKAEVSLFSGQGKLLNFSIGNPNGFSSPYLFKVKKVDIEIEPMSVFKDMVVIDKIFIDSPHIIFEQKGKINNLNAFQKNITSGSEKKVNAQNESKETTSEKSTQKHILIKDFVIKNAQVEVILTDLGVKKQVVLKEIHLKNLGGKDKSQKQIFADITNSLISQIIPAVAPSVQMLKESIKQIKGKVEKQVKGSLEKLKQMKQLQKNKENFKDLQKGLSTFLNKK